MFVRSLLPQGHSASPTPARRWGWPIAALLVVALFAPGALAQSGAGSRCTVIEPHEHPSTHQVQADYYPEIAAAGDRPSSSWAFFPVVIYSPETHLGVGGLAAHFFRNENASPACRSSNLALIAVVTTRKQAIVELHPDLYFAAERFRINGRLELARYPDSFWAIGNAADDASEERYKRIELRSRLAFRLRLFDRLYAGLRADQMYLDPEYRTGGTFDQQDIAGEAGGVTSGLGAAVTWDSRDNALAPLAGAYAELASLAFLPAFGSEYRFQRSTLDVRVFQRLFSESVLGFRLYLESLAGDVPFYQLAQLGGPWLLRGYFKGRFRDRHLAALQSEYRFPLVWRLGAVAFGGIAQISDHLDRLGSEPWRYSVGGGLRYGLSPEEHLNIRLDAGVGPDTFGVYLSASEAF